MRAAVAALDGAAVTCVVGGGGFGGALVGTDVGALHLGTDGAAAWIDWSRGRHVVDLAIDRSSEAVAVGTTTGDLAILDLDGGITEVSLGSRVRSLAWSPVYGLLAACSQLAGLVVLEPDGRRRFARPADARWRRVAWQHRQVDAPLVAAGAGGATWIDPIEAGEVRRHPMPGTATVLAVDPCGPWTAVGGLRGDLRIVEAEEEGEVEVVGWPDPVELLAWLPGIGQVVVAGGDEVTRWSGGESDGATEPEPARLALGGGRVTALAPHRWLPQVAIGSDEGVVALWDTVSGSSRTLAAPGPEVTALAWDPLGEQLFVGTRAGGSWLPAMAALR
ncbi:MAG: hypothetical protein KDA97_08090 [Acidimicrobiales bacterium]|nr:hypothetical protein [Acidimicrobiales bacterium]